MKRVIIPIVVGLFAASGISGCAQLDNVITNIGSLTGLPAAEVLAIASAVQADVAKVCQAEPDVVDIIALWNATAGATVAGIASVICSTVGQPPASARMHRGKRGLIWTPRPVVINGTVVHFD